MLSEPKYVTSFPTSFPASIFAIAGYYTDYDGDQHVIAAADDGNVYQVIWNPSRLTPPNVDTLWHFDVRPRTIAGFFTPDDNLHHAVATTEDDKLHELWFKRGELPPHKTDLHYDISGFHAIKGMASFYSPCDDLRHVVIVDRNGHPVDITWNAHNPTKGKTITITPTDDQIASISGFLSKDENPYTRHIIVAQKDTGQIYDIAYAYHVENNVSQNYVYVKTSFHEPVQNVTAFFSSDTNYRHIVVLTQANLLKDLAYPAYNVSGGNIRPTQLTSSSSPLANVADITSFYSAHDHLRHVLYVTKDGDLFEITYTSQG